MWRSLPQMLGDLFGERLKVLWPPMAPYPRCGIAWRLPNTQNDCLIEGYLMKNSLVGACARTDESDEPNQSLTRAQFHFDSMRTFKRFRRLHWPRCARQPVLSISRTIAPRAPTVQSM